MIYMNKIKDMAYSMLKLATGDKGIERKINDFKLRFPVRWHRYFPKEYEADNYGFLEKQVKQGADVIDIGAHIGLFSVRCSQLTGPTGKIIAFEPTPGTFSILKDTLRINNTGNVVPLQAAVSGDAGMATFYVSHTAGCNSNSLVKNKSEKELSAYDVQLYTIDGIVEEYSLKPSLIKIDVEGAELDVLKGGGKTFRELKPALILGLHPAFIKQKGDQLESIWQILSEAGYTIKEGGNALTKSDFCSRTILFDVQCT